MPAGEVSAGTQERKPPGSGGPNMPSSLASLPLLLSLGLVLPNEVTGFDGKRAAMLFVTARKGL